MTLRQWLQERGIEFGKVLAIHCSTDGFKKGRDNLMSISMTGSWPEADYGTAFIAGADAAKVKDFTEVDPTIYAKHAMPLDLVIGQISPIIDEADFIVIWYANYVKSWLEYMLPDTFTGKEMLDAAPLVKALEHKIDLPMDLSKISELNDRMTSATFHIKGGYKFDDVCARVIPGIDGDTPDAYLTGNTPKLERTVYMLWALWTALLDR